VQNRCLRIATGNHLASSIDHLHSEAGVLPVQEHLDMLCAQFLASAMSTAHPSLDLVLLPLGPRRNKHGSPLKETLQSKYGHVVEPYLNENGVMAGVSYKRTRDSIHTAAVQSAIRNQSPNPLIGRIAPLFPLPRDVSHGRCAQP
jgi:hypothetical protein